jgi:hypothetical protein
MSCSRVPRKKHQNAREITVHLNTLVRQSHRWLSIAFTMMAGAIFMALGLGQELAPWTYFLPLLPLALMTMTGLYMFFLPFAARRRVQRAGAQANPARS